MNNSTTNAVMNNFLATLGDCRELAESIAGYIDDHLGADPDRVSWAHVSQAQALRDALQDVAKTYNLAD